MRIALALAALLGCENPVDETENRLPTAPADAAPATGPDADAGGAGCPCLTLGDQYRFTTLRVASLDGGEHPVMGVLNALWEADIARSELNVVFEVVEIDGDRVRLLGMNGARLGQGDGTFCLLPVTAEEMKLRMDGCAFTMEEPAGINVYAGTESVPKNCAPDLPVPHTIPVRDVRLSGQFALDCSAILDGRADRSGIPRSALGRVCTCPTAPSAYAEVCKRVETESEGCAGCAGSYQNLERLLSQFSGGQLQLGCSTPEGEAAVCIDTRFTAERLSARTPICEGG